MLKNKSLLKDLRNVIEHVTATIVMNESEEEFYRRSGEATTQEDAKAILLEIADDLAKNRLRLEIHMEKLRQTLLELESEN
ncbi:MAG TPA: hypothetical protein DE036_08375, partial [Actinobacteria bacterium]|nr:hypothetical protein [Actinomycetota bacterium]